MNGCLVEGEFCQFAIPFKFLVQLFRWPSERFTHPFADLFRNGEMIAMIMPPIRPADHHIVQMNRPFVLTEMLNGLA